MSGAGDAVSTVGGVVRAALLSRCPRCGRGKLFAGLHSLAHQSPVCALDFSGFDPGDGPAVFVILIAGGIIAGAALWVEFTFSPPVWVHAALWIPGVFLISVGLLRLAKSALVVLQYRHQAHEGRRVE